MLDWIVITKKKIATVNGSSEPSANESLRMMTTKYSIKRLEISIKNFIKVLSIALDRLQKHSANIRRLTDIEDWSELHREQINATRTIQQIKANIREIEKARNQVNDEDQREFDNRISEVKAKAIAAMEEFMVLLSRETASELDGDSKSHGTSAEFGTGDLQPQPTSLPESHSLPPLPSSSSLSSSRIPAQTMSQSMYDKQHQSRPDLPPHGTIDDMVDNNIVDNMSASQQPPLLTMTLRTVPLNSEASASWEQLRESIEDLNELVHVFAENVEGQQEAVNRIEDNIDSAQFDTEQGTSHLAKIPWSNQCRSIRDRLCKIFFTRASKYKAAMFPAVGAVIGCVLGGPVGLVAGMKLGGLAGIGGAAMGYAGGRFVKKRQEKIVEMEMTKMSYSMHVPELEDEVLSGLESTPNPTVAQEETSSLTNDNNSNKGSSGGKSLGSSIKGWFGYQGKN